jgi:hypothetical protein
MVVTCSRLSAYIFKSETGSITIFGYDNIKCFIIKEDNPSKHYFNIAIVDFSQMFRLPQSNQHQTLHQKYKKKLFYICVVDDVSAIHYIILH